MTLLAAFAFAASTASITTLPEYPVRVVVASARIEAVILRAATTRPQASEGETQRRIHRRNGDMPTVDFQ